MFVYVQKEAGDDVIVIGRVVLAELRLYWPICYISADIVNQYDSDQFCHTSTVLPIGN